MITALLVSPDPEYGGPIADALERAGAEVMWCRGPSGPDCVCGAVHSKHCALTTDVDVVVVDTRLTSDQLGYGFQSSQLVAYYELLGLRVVALVDDVKVSAKVRTGNHVTLARSASPTSIAKVAAAWCTRTRRSALPVSARHA